MMYKSRALTLILIISSLVQIMFAVPQQSWAAVNHQTDQEDSDPGPLGGAEEDENTLYPSLIGDHPQDSEWYQLAPSAFEPSISNLPLAGVMQVVSGLGHTCALTASGGVKCWGDNWEGKLGNGSIVDSYVPVDVVGLTDGVSAISSSHKHSCALTANGGVKCWGRNWHGELGDGTTTYRVAPVEVTGLSSGVKGIAVGGFHTCALLTDGNIKCWGANWHGQLGDDSKEQRLLPVDVVGLDAPAIALIAGKYHTCALLETGGVQCWGYNLFGQLGNNSTIDRPVPQDVYLMSAGIKAITAGENHTCALSNAGEEWCWGNNAEGQLGIGNTDMQLIPTHVSLMGKDNLAIKAGMRFTCSITSSSTVKCWGENWAGQLGDGSQTRALTPVAVNGLSAGVTNLGAGDSHTCAVLATQGLMCWGSNSFGQIGDGESALRLLPTGVSNLSSGIKMIVSGGMHSCALTIDGAVKCWGNNKFGQLGDGTTIDSTTPVDVWGLDKDVTAIAAGGFHTCAIFRGEARCWGYNSNGQVGDGSKVTRLTPQSVEGILNPVEAIITGTYHSCALIEELGAIKCWGRNNNGQLGTGDKTDYLSAIPVEGVDGIRFSTLTAGDRHTCASTVIGNVWCWGYNSNGQLGIGTTEPQKLPVKVLDFYHEIASVRAGNTHTCALSYNGSIKCWGYNIYGELGDGTTQQRNSPVATNGLSGEVISLEAGGFHTCAILADKKVQCWGLNQSGQLGEGTTFLRVNPTYVSALESAMQTLGAGSATTCGVTADGEALCWGSHANGQVGDGTIPWVLTPLEISGVVDPKVTINYPNGQPGSFFTIVGEELPSETSVSFKVNSVPLMPEINTDADGKFMVLLDTTLAQPGGYTITVLIGKGYNLNFRLDDDAPLRTQEGTGLIYQIPSNIAMTLSLFLPDNFK